MCGRSRYLSGVRELGYDALFDCGEGDQINPQNQRALFAVSGAWCRTGQDNLLACLAGVMAEHRNSFWGQEGHVLTS